MREGNLCDSIDHNACCSSILICSLVAIYRRLLQRSRSVRLSVELVSMVCPCFCFFALSWQLKARLLSLRLLVAISYSSTGILKLG